MTVGELKAKLAGFKDDAPVLMEDFTMREIHEVRSVSGDRMCEWVAQQMRDVCVISTKDDRNPTAARKAREEKRER